MFKKTGKFSLIMVLVAMMGVAVLSGGLFLFNGKKARFNAEGYCLRMNNTELATTVEQLKFAAETQYSSSFPSSYTFRDIAGGKQKVSELSYIHYIDGSASSFVNGLVVNMQEIAQGYLEFFTLEPGMVMSRTLSGWKIDANGHDVDFDEMLWQIDEKVVLLTGNKMKTVMAGGEAIEVKDFLEIRWIEDNIVQIMTADQGWQVVTPNSFVEFESGARFDLNSKYVLNANGEGMFSMEDMSAEMKSAIPLSSTSYLDWNLPQFNIVGEDGKIGENGEVGQQGQIGIQGETGKTSSSGEDGTSGLDGAAGGNGGPRDNQLGNDGDRLARISVGAVNVANPTSVNFTLTVDDELETLANTGGVVEIRDQKSGLLAWSSPVILKSTVSPATFPVNVSGLEPDHNYTIFVKHNYEAEVNGVITSGNKIFVRRNFTTSSEGLSIDVSEITQNTFKVTLKKSNVFTANEVALKIWFGNYFIDYPFVDSGLTYLDPFNAFNTTETETIHLADLFRAKYPDAQENFDSNQQYRIEVLTDASVVSDGSGNDHVEGTLCKAEATGVMMKSIPQLGDVDITEVSAANGKYRFHCNVVKDDDHALQSFTFTVRNGDGILIDRITTDSDTLNWFYGTALDPEVYYVSCTAEYNDNEKMVTLTGGTNYMLNAGEFATSHVTFEPYTKKSGMFIDRFSNNILTTESYGWRCSTCAKFFAECELGWKEKVGSVAAHYVCPDCGANVAQRKETVDAVCRDKIRGDIVIKFDLNTRVIDKTKPVTLQVKCLEDDAFLREWTETLSDRTGSTLANTNFVYINLIGLAPNHTYVISAYGTVKTTVSNSTDDWTASAYGYIGSVQVKTLE